MAKWVRLTPESDPRSISVIECRLEGTRLYLRARDAAKKGNFCIDFPPLYPVEFAAIPPVAALVEAARALMADVNRSFPEGRKELNGLNRYLDPICAALRALGVEVDDAT